MFINFSYKLNLMLSKYKNVLIKESGILVLLILSYNILFPCSS